MNRSLIFIVVVGFILSSCQPEELSYEYSVIGIKHVDPEPTFPEENIAPVFKHNLAGRNTAVTKEITEKIALYTEGAYNGDRQKYMDRVFKLTLKTSEQKKIFEQLYDRQNSSMKFTLHESYPVYISRAVECDIMFAYVVENRTKFDIQLNEENVIGKTPIENILKTKYGKRFVSWDEESMTFHIDGSHVLYAVTPKDTLDMYFMDEVFMHGSGMREFVDSDELSELRRYFSEAPLYQR